MSVAAKLFAFDVREQVPCIYHCVSLCSPCQNISGWLFAGRSENFDLDEARDFCPRCTYPVCWPALAMYRDSIRDPPCHLMAYAVPSDEAIFLLASLKRPVIECGAGTGYWASLLRAQGVTVAAYDIAPNRTAQELLDAAARGHGGGIQRAASHNEYHAEMPAWTTVLRGGAESASGRDAPFDGASAVLFLCYPPPKSPMALECLSHFKGDVVAYVGEWQGDTATHAFERLLSSNFICLHRQPLPNWGSTAYSLT